MFQLEGSLFVVVFISIGLVLRERGGSLGRKSFGDVHQFFLNFQDRSFLGHGIFVEVLHEEKGKNVEVVLVLSKQLFYQVVYLVDTGQLEFIGAGQPHNVQNFLLENFFSTDRFFSLVVVERFKIGLEFSHEFLQHLSLFIGDSSILPPGLSFFVELFKSLIEKLFVTSAQVVVISR